MRLTHRLYQKIESHWWRKERPCLLLRGLSKLYRIVSKYDQKKRQKNTLKTSLPLISIGNISVGGSGKTPFTIWLAHELIKHHFKPVILCRGDGGKQKSPQLLNSLSLANEVGDEAILLYRMSHCPVISAHDRVTASQLAMQHGDIILLDDGFQYRQLQRQCDIVLIPDDGFGNGYVLPAGPLRESPKALGRSDIIVRTGFTTMQSLTDRKEWHWHVKEQRLKDWKQCNMAAPKSVIAISAIARPQRFKQSLQELDIHIQDAYFFPDHHAFTKKDLHPIWQQDAAIVVTAKDAVKLLKLWPKNRPLWVLEQNFEAEKGLTELILTHVKKQ